MDAASLVETRVRVPAEWTDGNGHMNVACYVLAFDRATDAFYDALGIRRREPDAEVNR